MIIWNGVNLHLCIGFFMPKKNKGFEIRNTLCAWIKSYGRISFKATLIELNQLTGQLVLLSFMKLEAGS
ncbi:hypothetical protein ABE28_000925 [Peribacillus muralis]|uniref:Uncharacterized protein n=1 Tax=Peribacillus muralis TaxID=264697 RepID=A0A1B3XI73_9BACI|nr:hypothetical protein ABE28_000925 [Peribacillus muralis]